MSNTQSVQANENTLQKIQREGVMHAATEPAFEPFEFMQNGEIVGYGTDILHEVAKRMGVKLDQRGMEFDAVLPGLLSKKFDLVATSLIATEERKKKFAFTIPIAKHMPVIVSYLGNKDIHDNTDLSNKIVGAQVGSSLIPEFEILNNKFKSENKPGFKKFVEFKSFPDINLALLERKIDATVLPLPMALNLIKKEPGKLAIVGKWNSEREYVDHGVTSGFSWAVRKEDGDLRDRIDAIFTEMKNDGTLDSLQTKWFGKNLSEVESDLNL